MDLRRRDVFDSARIAAADAGVVQLVGRGTFGGVGVVYCGTGGREGIMPVAGCAIVHPCAEMGVLDHIAIVESDTAIVTRPKNIVSERSDCARTPGTQFCLIFRENCVEERYFTC